jgi:hypothetical protein
MSAEVFWSLGWYDLNLWVEKIIEDRKRRNEDRELTMEMTRQMMCLFANANRGKDAPVFKPNDFIRLSYDKEEEEVKVDAKELEERLDKFPKTLNNGK